MTTQAATVIVPQPILETLNMDESYAKNATQTGERKNDHIRINLNKDVTHTISTGLEKLRFVHRALPELDLSHVDPSVSFLEHSLDLPLLISSMTGGTPDAFRINIRLAEAPSFGQSVFQYASDCNGAADYGRLAREVLGLPPDEPMEHAADTMPVVETVDASLL